MAAVHALQESLYFAGDELEGPAKRGRNASTRTFIENGWINTESGQLHILFCCRWSTSYLEVAVDLSSGLAFCLDENAALSALLDQVSGRLQGAAASPLRLIAVLAKEVDNASGSLWPVPSGSAAAALASPAAARARVESAVRSVLHADGSAGSAGSAAVQQGLQGGLRCMVSLLVGAFYNLRRPIICKPVPHWWLVGRGGGGGGGVSASSDEAPGSPHSQQVAMDATAMDTALTQLTAALGAAGTLDPGALPIEALLLVYWLLVLAPVRLLQLPRSSSSSSGGAHSTSSSGEAEPECVSYAVCHGPAHLAAPAIAPTWDAEAVAAHGTLPVPCYHGTPSDNAYAALHYGLRPLSGSRHQGNGALFGDGVYLTNHAKLALGFAKKAGLAWSRYAYPTSSSTSITASAAASVTQACGYRVVLQLAVVAAPTTRIVHRGADITAQLLPHNKHDNTASTANTANTAVNAGGQFDLPPAAYVVVPRASHLWLTHLHVYHDSVGSSSSASISAASGSAASSGSAVDGDIAAAAGSSGSDAQSSGLRHRGVGGDAATASASSSSSDGTGAGAGAAAAHAGSKGSVPSAYWLQLLVMLLAAGCGVWLWLWLSSSAAGTGAGTGAGAGAGAGGRGR